MNIAVIRRKYDPNGGGAEKYAAYVVNELVSRGHAVTVFAEKSANIPPTVTLIPVSRPILPTLCRTASFAKRAQSAVAKYQFDIIFALSRYEGADVYRQAEQLHVVWLPIYYSFFSRFNPRHAGILALERRVFDSSSTGIVVTNSELVRSQVIDNFSFDESRVKVVRNGVDRDRFYRAQSQNEINKLRSNLGLKQDSLILLFVAGNFAIKGLDKAILAVAALKDECKNKITLVVVGGDDPNFFQQLANAHGVGDKILFVGKQNSMRDFYITADLLFYPSLYEPFANVCLEACACGLPVLTTSQNGSSELIVHGENGYIVERADHVLQMADYVNQYNELSAGARIRVSDNAFKATEGYSWGAHVDCLELMFKDIKRKKI